MGNAERFVIYACILLEAEEFGRINADEIWLLCQLDKQTDQKTETKLDSQGLRHATEGNDSEIKCITWQIQPN